jgi:hypothetical protein
MVSAQPRTPTSGKSSGSSTAVGAWVVCRTDMLSVVKLMRWLDSTPTPSSMQSRGYMWRIDTVGLDAASRWQRSVCKKPKRLRVRDCSAMERPRFVCVDMEGRREIFRSGLCPTGSLPLPKVRHPHEQPYRYAQGHSNPIGLIDEHAGRTWHTDALRRLLTLVCVTSHSTQWRSSVFLL